MQQFDMARRLVAEALGTGFLLATIVGSGIMADKLAGGNTALALLCHTIPVGAILVVLILVFGPVSGGHFNPAVTLSFAIRREISAQVSCLYVAAQLVGGIIGVAVAHAMFELPVFQFSDHARTGAGQWFAEVVATFGLVATILGTRRFTPSAVPYAVGLFILAAQWFTASTSFANPAVTLARGLTETFTGIHTEHILAFVLCQLAGAVLAAFVFAWLLKPEPTGS